MCLCQCRDPLVMFPDTHTHTHTHVHARTHTHTHTHTHTYIIIIVTNSRMSKEVSKDSKEGKSFLSSLEKKTTSENTQDQKPDPSPPTQHGTVRLDFSAYILHVPCNCILSHGDSTAT